MKPLVTRGKYSGQPSLFVCDRKCSKAWGINLRKREQLSADDVDDYELLADSELDDAPADPGTYDGGQGKPQAPVQIHNKWCVRECERSQTITLDGPDPRFIELTNFDIRVPNMRARRTEDATRKVPLADCEVVMSAVVKALGDLELYAWVGEDERGSGEVGLKQGATPCGLIPLVATSLEKLDDPGLIEQIQKQVNNFGKPIQLCRFHLAGVELIVTPESGKN